MKQDEIIRLKAQFLAKMSKYSDWQALNFPALLALVSDDAFFAALFGKEKRTIESWRKLHRVPAATASARIINVSNSVITPNKIYTPYIEKLLTDKEATQ